MQLFLGIDVGTQGAKALVLDAQSKRIVGRAARSYDLIPGLPPGHAEQHPDTWIEALRGLGQDLSSQVELNAVRALAISGQQHGLVVLDEDGQVLRAAKLWCDTSTAAEARELEAQLGRPVPTGYTASKIPWLARHEPELWKRTCSVLLPHDYINYRLTGVRSMEFGDASGTGFFDPVARTFDAAAVEACGGAQLAECLPELQEPRSEQGRLTEEGAALLGLQPGLPVGTGGGDNMMSALGSGASQAGVVVVSLGTSGTVFTHSDRPVVDPSGQIAPFCGSAGGWLPLLCVMNLTGVAQEVHLASGADHGELTQRAEQVAAGSEGLLWLPYLQGERVPDLPDATGTLLGMRPGCLEPARLYRAALEGTSLNLAWGVRRMRDLGIAVDRVNLVGGAARNPLWRSILASCLDAPVTPLEEPESAALGAALQALWTASESGASLAELGAPFVQAAEAPTDPTQAGFYGELGARFEEAVARIYGAASAGLDG